MKQYLKCTLLKMIDNVVVMHKTPRMSCPMCNYFRKFAHIYVPHATDCEICFNTPDINRAEEDEFGYHCLEFKTFPKTLHQNLYNATTDMRNEFWHETKKYIEKYNNLWINHKRLVTKMNEIDDRLTKSS